jgi:hypothetical protein
MPRDEEITFADHMGRFYARRFGFPPMVGRVLGYLLVCEPRDQTIAELSDALLASRSAITGALSVLETIHAVRRSRAAGERSDRVRIDFPSAQGQGLEVVSDAPPEHRAELLELAAFADFLVESTEALRLQWEARRDALRASGELPS